MHYRNFETTRSVGMSDFPYLVPYEDFTSKELKFIKYVEKDLDLRLKNPSSTVSFFPSLSKSFIRSPSHKPSSNSMISGDSSILDLDLISLILLTPSKSRLGVTNPSFPKIVVEGCS